MQVKSDKIISDLDSVILGTNKILNSYKKSLKKIEDGHYDIHEWHILNSIFSDYNGGESYSSEVYQLYSIIKETFYKKSQDSLEPIINNGL